MKLWVAQGFGVGRIPVAPGTFGSVAGVLWFGLLLLTGSMWLFIAGTIAAIALSVWLCGAAEKILGQTDPGSVVLDEIAAMPVCFLGLVILMVFKTHLAADTGSICRLPLLRCRQALACVSKPVVARRLGRDD